MGSGVSPTNSSLRLRGRGVCSVGFVGSVVIWKDKSRKERTSSPSPLLFPGPMRT